MMIGTVRMTEADGSGAHANRGSANGEGEAGMRYMLTGRIGPYAIAGVHVRLAEQPGLGEPVTLKLHGVGRFLGRVSRIQGGRIRLTFDQRAGDGAELVPSPA